MKPFRLIVATPSGNAYEGDTVMLTLRGQSGDLAVLAGHTPFVTTVVPCDIKIEQADGEEKHGHTEGGLLSVGTDGVTLLSGSFQMKE